jgi:hypothetical protein
MSEGVGRTLTFYVEISTTSAYWNPCIARKHRTKVLLVNPRKTSVLSWEYFFSLQRKRNASATQRRWRYPRQVTIAFVYFWPPPIQQRPVWLLLRINKSISFILKEYIQHRENDDTRIHAAIARHEKMGLLSTPSLIVAYFSVDYGPLPLRKGSARLGLFILELHLSYRRRLNAILVRLTSSFLFSVCIVLHQRSSESDYWCSAQRPERI